MNHDHHDHGMMMGHNHGAAKVDQASVAETTTEHDHSAMMGGDGRMDHMMMMQMYFEVTYKATILFKEWNTNSVGAMVGSCIGIFLLAILYEGLKFFREHLHRKNCMAIDYSTVKGPESNGSQVSQTKRIVSFRTSMTSGSHYIQTLLHLVQLTLSYLLMLIVMTYNVWLFISVVLGCTVGYFLFGWHKGFLVDITEHCH